MRLSELARVRGLDAFSAEDFVFVGSKLSVDPARLILVGGQALETWGLYFGIERPSGNQSPLTEDTDFFGSKKDAIWLCGLLGKKETELILAKDFDPSPNTAIAYLERPGGRVLLIDFLRGIVGVTEQDMKRAAVPLDVSGVKLHILHPLHCLESRLANLDKLAVKRNTNGVLQAQWAVSIANAYLKMLLAQGAEGRELIKACHQIAEGAEYRSGPFCFASYGIDPLAAVCPEVVDGIGGMFKTEDWPRRVARIAEKRKKRFMSYRFSLPGG